MSVTEAGHRLHVSRPVLYDLIRSGKLRSLRVGRVHRVPVWALDEFVAGELSGKPHPAA
ncbi:MAG TPA: helix-turn-helix domain-containing protein [Acidimicrobiales bacterium]|nr:helix-turn-helix domain-containing protein [Acidimicrobiales bacterium]